MKHDTFNLGPPCYESGGCVVGCRACQYNKLQDENAKLRAEVKEWKDAARKEREYSLGVEKNRDSIVLQNRELAEAKGNLLDFIGCVRLWAVGQPTAKSIQESCLGILEKYAEKRVEEGQKCEGCQQVKPDVLPYCHECYMMT